MSRTSWNFRLLISAALASGTLLAAASSVAAASQVWYTNGIFYGTPGVTTAVGRAGLDGSSPTTVIDKATTPYVSGATVDLWSGKLFYIRAFPREIVSANLDGSNPQVILSGDAVAPSGGGAAWDLVYDRGTDSLYWTTTIGGPNTTTVRRARADGSSPATLFSTPNSLGYDLAVVPELNRVYWTDVDTSLSQKIRYGNIDGSGSSQAITTDCAGGDGYTAAIAVDPSQDRMFFQSADSAGYPYKMRRSKLDGTGCVTGSSMYLYETDDAIALDRGGNQIVTANQPGFAGPGGLWAMNPSTLAAPGAAFLASTSTLLPARPFIVEPPKPIGASASLTASGTTPGSTLTLAAVQDTFAPDEPGIRVFRGVTTKSTAWYRDGVLLPGETGSTLTATEPGVYKAVISASNIAGSVETTSNEVTIAVKPDPGPTPGPTPSNAFTAVAVAGRSGTVATIARVPGAGKVRQVVTRVAGGKRVGVCSTPSKTATGPGRVRLACKVNSATRSAQKKGPVRLRVRVTYTPTGGTSRTVTRYVTLRSLKPNYTG